MALHLVAAPHKDQLARLHYRYAVLGGEESEESMDSEHSKRSSLVALWEVIIIVATAAVVTRLAYWGVRRLRRQWTRHRRVGAWIWTEAKRGAIHVITTPYQLTAEVWKRPIY